MYLKEKLQVSVKLHSGMTYSAVGQDLKVNESILCKQKQHTEQDGVLTTGLEEPSSAFLLGNGSVFVNSVSVKTILHITTINKEK